MSRHATKEHEKPIEEEEKPKYPVSDISGNNHDGAHTFADDTEFLFVTGKNS